MSVELRMFNCATKMDDSNNNILQDWYHSAQDMLHLLPSGRRYWSISTRTTRMAHSLYPQAVRLLNGHPPFSAPTHHGHISVLSMTVTELDIALLQQPINMA
ncbi:hypothetical protein CHARACLAT_033328 [Characodon lateralis]|uniref:Uncharacterized protein n=1 Tax=Characodon lateralis TaxID=208331 RepID=A0ABU7EGF2_9TELE|nr:hypothetical protein [Characodon lateralis]